MKKILCRFAHGKKLIVSSKARKELFDPETKSMASPPPPPHDFQMVAPLTLFFLMMHDFHQWK